MNHREYFDKQAKYWDSKMKVDLRTLQRVVGAAGIKEKDMVLDVGTGTGILLPSLSKATGKEGKVFALDISGEMLVKARSKKISENIRYIQADVEQFPFFNEIFSHVICFAAFPHFLNKRKALAEISRVLRKGGKLVIAHAAGRETINARHRELGGILAEDQIPEEEKMKKLFRDANFFKLKIVDEADFYMAEGLKNGKK